MTTFEKIQDSKVALYRQCNVKDALERFSDIFEFLDTISGALKLKNQK